jgi:arginine utilization regulatory protein
MNKAEAILKHLLENIEEGIHIVDNLGKTIYYNQVMGKVEGLDPKEVIGSKPMEFLRGVEEESSTLMNALKRGEKYVDVVQHYGSHLGKEVTTINTTIPVIEDGEVIAAIEISKDMTQLRELNEKICRLQDLGGNNKYYTFKDITGSSPKLKEVVSKAMRASLSNSTVLIYGETGSGKELFSQSIHYNGIRKDKPFIAINCAAIPSTLLEGMLFGTVKGSFTGAENKKGLFEEANGGTILLDEVNSLEPSLQSKLLRVLQEGYIRPLGSNLSVDVDVRIIATLNEEPDKLIKEGRMRKDFYYRLSVIKIDIPPLRERIEDIGDFVRQFIKYYNKLLGKNILDVDEEVKYLFLNYHWPGNVRELKNIIEASMNMIDNSSYITKKYIDNRLIKSTSNSVHKDMVSTAPFFLTNHMESLERQILEETLKRFNYNISKAAAYLNVSRQNLQYKIKKHKLL